MRGLSLVVGAAIVLASTPARAYRPFDEPTPTSPRRRCSSPSSGAPNYYRQGSRNFVIAPALVLNFGLGANTELVIDAQEYFALGAREAGVPRANLLGDDVMLKHIFREGTLQEKSGVSIAAEGGVLTPEIHWNSGFGASLDVITSYRWAWGTVHWNEWIELTREHHADLFTGVILEGPHAWTVRPVAEILYEKDFAAGQTESLLVRAIWEARESLDFDIGLRAARLGDENAAEVRLGLTWALPMGGDEEPEAGHAKSRRLRPLHYASLR